MAKAGDLVVDLSLDTSKFVSALNGIKNQLSFSRLFGASFLANIGSNVVSGIVGTMRSLGSSMLDAGKFAVQMAADFESTAVSMEVLLKSGDAAKDMLQRLQSFALETPFGFMDTVRNARTLMARGFGKEQIVPMMRAIGDTAAAMGGGNDVIDNITLAISQIAAKGKLQAEEMTRQLGQYIPALKYVADHLGKTQAEVMKMLEGGEISAGTALTAIFKGMKENFGGTMARQFQTLRGGWQNFKEQIEVIARDIGSMIIAGFNLNGLVADLRKAGEVFRSEWAPLLRGVINGIGAQWQNLWRSLKSQWTSWLGDSVRTALAFASQWRLSFRIIENLFTTLSDNIKIAMDVIEINMKATFNRLIEWFIAQQPKFAKFAGLEKPSWLDTIGASGRYKPFLNEDVQALIDKVRERTRFRGGIRDKVVPEGELSFPANFALGETGGDTRETEAAVAFSREAISSIAKTANSSRSPAIKVAKDQLTELKKANVKLADISSDLHDMPMLGQAVLSP